MKMISVFLTKLMCELTLYQYMLIVILLGLLTSVCETFFLPIFQQTAHSNAIPHMCHNSPFAFIFTCVSVAKKCLYNQPTQQLKWSFFLWLSKVSEWIFCQHQT